MTISKSDLETSTFVQTTDPRTGEQRDTAIRATRREEAADACIRAGAAFAQYRNSSRQQRAALLRAMAGMLEGRRAELVKVADGETALGEARLNGELTRTIFQLRFFADVVDEGSYLEATIDHAGDTEMGPRPELRRMLVPIGPVAVFGASNFPFAFSVPGGDTAAALATGCPVILKAHESHPETSQACFEALRDAAAEVSAPVDVVSIVFGRDAGAEVVLHPQVKAVGFTGSLGGGRALLDLISRRPDPIPFYGELAGINPLIVTPGAAEARGKEIGEGLAASTLLGAGQFCTKPGVALVPAGDAGDRLVVAAAAVFAAQEPPVMLNGGIAESFDRGASERSSLPGVRVRGESSNGTDRGFAVAPRLLEVDADELRSELLEECFGPLCVVIRYSGPERLTELLEQLPQSLTATIHAEDDESIDPLVGALHELAGRLVFNAYPTGVAVAWAMHHGGSWPSTNSLHTSVGATSIRRFLRPVAWQGAPARLLPPELRDDFTDIPRRVDGRFLPAGRRPSTEL
jgi:NADP-dependent aldehyde dehydrogenase